MSSERLQLHAVPTQVETENLLTALTKLKDNTGKLGPLKNIAKYLNSQLSATHAIVQLNVQDPDYFDEYLEYYSRQFKNADRYCIRVHFFKVTNLVSSPLPRILEFIDAVDTDNAYLGFVTLRPTSQSPIAATILRPPAITSMFVTCRETFPVHLAGRAFNVEGTPFLQQDNSVGACAQASLWMALRTIRKRDGNRAFSPAKITTTAFTESVFGRMIPNREGLNLTQMIKVVQAAGYSTHVIALDKKTTSDSKKILYRYVESGIPVILVLGSDDPASSQHAVVAIGHGKLVENKTPTSLYEIRVNGSPTPLGKIQLTHASDWTDTLIINDEGIGPYTILRESSRSAVVNGETGYCLKDAKYAMPLLPPDVFLSGEEASVCAIKVVEAVLPTDAKVSNFGHIVKRTYLMDRHEFRTWAATENFLSTTVKEKYRTCLLPKRLWITELSLGANYHEAGQPKNKAVRFGELICDASMDAEESSFLLLHLNYKSIDPSREGVLMCGNPSDPMKLPDVVKLQDETGYGPYTRPYC